MSGRSSRIAVVAEDRCRPSKCGLQCRKRCPVNATGRHCIEVTPSSKLSLISEDLCVGCAICVKVCPFNGIQIINLPSSLDKETTHRLPVPKPGQVLGLVGTNGIGKTTALKILAGILKPNLGNFIDAPSWDEIFRYFRGSELQKYFTRLVGDNMKVTEYTEEKTEGLIHQCYNYPTMIKTRRGFKLSVTEGSFNGSQIIVMLGENGTRKTTFIRMLAWELKPDEVGDEQVDMPAYTVSYKRQELVSKYSSTVSVRDLLHEKIPGSCTQAQFRSDVMKPMKIEELMERQVANLSGGELQRFKLCICLGKPADIYLIDEPSAHLDSEQRLVAEKVIKRFIVHQKKTAFIVEHDFIMAACLADKVLVFEGKPSVECTASAPESLASGINRFLSHLDVTFRTDPTTHRPRINKLGSVKDTEQKAAGCCYVLP